ncbi:MAG TPA: type II toxin-antitoxin system VapC family toxin [Terriglobales bacterium]
MRLLLDTHVWLWAELEPTRIPTPLQDALSDPNNELWLSPVSSWELLLLVERGRVALAHEVSVWVEECLAGGRYRQALLNFAVTMAASQVHLPHRDPSDRLLAATARHYDLLLLTSDARLQSGSGYSIYPA